MSKRNRENRAAKKRAAAKRAPKRSDMPPEVQAFAGTHPEAVQARRRFGILMPFMWLAERQPFTPGMDLPDGSLIIGKEKKGVIFGDQVPPAIAEATRELDIPVDEIIGVLADAVGTGLITITESTPGSMEAKALDLFSKLAGRVEVVVPR